MAEGIYCFQKSRFHSLFFLHPHPDAYGEIALELGGCSSINWKDWRPFFFFLEGGRGEYPQTRFVLYKAAALLAVLCLMHSRSGPSLGSTPVLDGRNGPVCKPGLQRP